MREPKLNTDDAWQSPLYPGQAAQEIVDALLSDLSPKRQELIIKTISEWAEDWGEHLRDAYFYRDYHD